MTFLEDFGFRLHVARVGKGMTQVQLAQQVGVSSNCISMYETGKRMPSLFVTSNMAHVLDVSLDDLIPYALHKTPIDPCQTVIFDLIGEDDENGK